MRNSSTSRSDGSVEHASDGPARSPKVWFAWLAVPCALAGGCSSSNDGASNASGGQSAGGQPSSSSSGSSGGPSSGSGGSSGSSGSATAGSSASGGSAESHASGGMSGGSPAAGGVAGAGAGGTSRSSGGAGSGTGGTAAVTTGGQSGGSPSAAGGSSDSPPSKSSGCGRDPDAAPALSIDVNDASAEYLLSVPKNYDKNRAYPLIFAFHGAGVPPSTFVTYFSLPTVVGSDAIVVTPQCLGNASAWEEKRDLPLFDALLERMKSQYCIDTTRIFAGGHSSGGFFTNMLGCRRGDVLRGIAALSAGPPSGTCVGEVAVWISQGNADPVVTPDAGGRKARDFWLGRNGCSMGSMPVSPEPTVEYAGCNAGLPVRYCEYDGEHNLPPYAPKGIWDFFKSL